MPSVLAAFEANSIASSLEELSQISMAAVALASVSACDSATSRHQDRVAAEVGQTGSRKVLRAVAQSQMGGDAHRRRRREGGAQLVSTAHARSVFWLLDAMADARTTTPVLGHIDEVGDDACANAKDGVRRRRRADVHPRVRWLDRNGLHAGFLLLQVLASTGQRAAGADAVDQVVDLASSLRPQLGPGGLVVRSWVCRVLELVGAPVPANRRARHASVSAVCQ